MGWSARARAVSFFCGSVTRACRAEQNRKKVSRFGLSLLILVLLPSVGFARTLAGLKLEAWLGSLSTDKKVTIWNTSNSVGTSQVGPEPFNFGTYTGSITAAGLPQVLNFYLNEIQAPGVDAWKATNSDRMPPGAPPWGDGAYNWVKYNACVGKNGYYYEWWHAKARAYAANEWNWSVGYSAVPIGQSAPNEPSTYTTYPDRVSSADASGWIVDTSTDRCAGQLDIYSYYAGTYAGGAPHPEIVDEFISVAQQYVRERSDATVPFNPPTGITIQGMTPSQASEVADPDCPAGQEPQADGNCSGGGGSGGGRDPSDPTTEVDYETNCKVYDLFCWARWAFESKVDWDAQFGEIRETLLTKVPFGYIGWIDNFVGVQSGNPLSFQFMTATIDYGDTPVVQWWQNTGQNWLMFALYASFFGWLIRVVLQ